MGEWSRGEILDAITEWAGRYGDPPAVVDWTPSLARRHGLDERAARWERGRWPHANHVSRAFGSWNQAIRAAGLTPRSRGVRRSAPRAAAA